MPETAVNTPNPRKHSVSAVFLAVIHRSCYPHDLYIARKGECEGGNLCGFPPLAFNRPPAGDHFCAAKVQLHQNKSHPMGGFCFGGAEGSRTPVRKHFDRTFSGRSQVSAFPPCAGTWQTAQFSRVMMRGRGNSYPPHGRHLNDAFPGRWPLRFRRSLLKQRRQQY